MALFQIASRDFLFKGGEAVEQKIVLKRSQDQNLDNKIAWNNSRNDFKLTLNVRA